MLIQHVTSSRFCLYLLNVYQHIQRHNTCTIRTQEEWRQSGTGAWLRGEEESLCYRPCTHRKKNVRKHRYSRIKRKRFEHIELPAKLLDYFLRSSKSNIIQCTTHLHSWRAKRSPEPRVSCCSLDLSTPLLDTRFPFEWEPLFRAGFPNRNRNRSVPVIPNVWPICNICDGYKLSQIWICDLIFPSVFYYSFFREQVWSHFGHKCHKWSQLWLVHFCFCLCFDWNGSEWTKYWKTYHKVSSVSVFCLESGSERLKGSEPKKKTAWFLEEKTPKILHVENARWGMASRRFDFLRPRT